jgi:hypothetical protein
LGDKNVQQGDVFTLKLSVSGIGNIHNINAPLLKLPAGCSIYGDPEREEDVQFTEEGVTGTITFTYNIQLHESGTKIFAAPSLSYFDPVKEQYITLKSEGFVLEIAPNKSYQPLAHQGENSLKSHSDAISSDSEKNQGTGEKEGSVVQLLIGIVAPISGIGLLFVFLLLRKKRNSISESDSHSEVNCSESPLTRIQATTPVLDYWKEANEKMNDKNLFAVLLPKAIIQSVETKFSCCFSSRDDAFMALENKNPNVSSGLREIINHCDLYRYGFENEDIDPALLFEEARLLIERI